MKRFMKVKLCALLTLIALCVSMTTTGVFANNTAATQADGIYVAEVLSSSSMFKITNAILTIADGNMSAKITLSGTGYSKLFMGTAEEAENAQGSEINFELDGDGKYVFTIPVTALNTDISVAAYSTSKSVWYDRTLTFSINTDIPAEGHYSIDVWTSSSMFNIINTRLTVHNNTMKAIITMSGTGYTKLFMGTAEEATASEDNMIEYVTNSEGKYTFELPIQALNKGINIASYSANKEVWYDRTIILYGNTLEAVLDPIEEVEEAEVEKTEAEVEETEVEVEEIEVEETEVEEVKAEETKAEETNKEVEKAEVGTEILEPSVTTEVEQLPATGEASTIETETFILLAVACAAVMVGIVMKRKKQVIN